MRNHYSFLLSFLLFSSCVISLNETGYNYLKDDSLDRLRKYNPQEQGYNQLKLQGKIVYEITATDLQFDSRRNDYTLIHLWRPFCSNESCQVISPYAEFSRTHRGLKFYLISETYGIEDIDTIAINSKYNLPIFVLESAHYGIKLKKARNLFFTELFGAETKEDLESLWNADYYLFKGKEFILKSKSLEEIDELLLSAP
ncbi:hypothetical protein GYB22_13840 [bacterium]|nr:hypothetical protein [bacterium]